MLVKANELQALNKPHFRLEEYFDGKCRAWGIFQDRFGRPRRRFTVDIDGRFDGETLTLSESFLFSDGETEHRTWLVRPVGENGYEGRADGVLGTARGNMEDNTLNWTYRFALKIGTRTLNVHFDDWFFLLNDGVLINRADISKFGIRLGQATIVFRQQKDF